MGSLTILLLLLTFCALIAEAANQTNAVKEPFVIYTFNSTIIPENIVLRRNNQLLVSCLTCPGLYQLDPTQGSGQIPKVGFLGTPITHTWRIITSSALQVAHEFTGYTSTTGIVELEPDIFALGLDNFTLEGGPVRGTWNLWTVDLRNCVAPEYDSRQVRITRIASAPHAFLGGITIVNRSRGLIAATDYAHGTLWLVDIVNKHSSPIITSPQLVANTGAGEIGVNGLKYKDGKLYFMTTTTGLYGYVPINGTTGSAIGGVVPIFDYAFELDDFVFAPSGNLYLTKLNSTSGGVCRRLAGARSGQNETIKVVAQYGTNSVVVNDKSCGCTFFLLRP
jgi:hypothetical protein